MQIAEFYAVTVTANRVFLGLLLNGSKCAQIQREPTLKRSSKGFLGKSGFHT